MKKIRAIGVVVVFFLSMSAFAQSPPVSIYSISIPLVSGVDTLNMASWSGKKILIVNTATQSQFVDQLTELEQLYQQFKDSGLVVLACPSNRFGLEPYSDPQIGSFFANIYQTSFKVSKTLSIDGNSADPLFQWLLLKSRNGTADTRIRTDFTKYLVSTEGKLVAFFEGSISPLDERVKAAIRAN
jgi:glutathione peroxidase